MENKLELLAPVGKMDVLASVLQAGADAVYLGGKLYNMRMLRPEYNFSRDELKKATDLLHHENKKLYITVNNLYTNHEMDGLADYLVFLDSLGVDALIVQDLGLIELHRQLGLKVPLHGSVQMGLGNAEAVHLLAENQFNRVILSKNVSLDEIKQIHQESPLGIEYFVHGDLCISHTGQCHMSSFLCGDSGNRGLCCKPCRWAYELHGEKHETFKGFQHFLSHHDLCLHPYLQNLIEAGVSSFKIEGRMRDAGYLSKLIGYYRHALDRFMENPVAYQFDENESRQLEELRIRDYSTGSLFQRPDKNSVGFDGRREPWPSQAISLQTISQQAPLQIEGKVFQQVPEISVRVGDLASVQAAFNAGADYLVVSMDSWRQNHFTWSKEAMQEALQIVDSEKCKILIETPRIVTEFDLPEIFKMRDFASFSEIAGFVVNDLGSLRILKSTGKLIWGGIGLNVANQNAAAFLKNLGAGRINVSVECSAEELEGFIDQTSDLELLAQGPMVGMISDYCIARTAWELERDECGSQCLQDEYALLDHLGQCYPIRTDKRCRNYVLYPHQRCLFQKLPKIMDWGIKSIRIDGQSYPADQVYQLVNLYREAMEQIAQGNWKGQDALQTILNMFPEGLSEGPLYGDISPDRHA